MAYQAIVEEIKDLPEESQNEILVFIQFLKYRNQQKNSGAEKKVKRVSNTMAGKLVYMADDFDETPECFKEYM